MFRRICRFKFLDPSQRCDVSLAFISAYLNKVLTISFVRVLQKVSNKHYSINEFCAKRHCRSFIVVVLVIIVGLRSNDVEHCAEDECLIQTSGPSLLLKYNARNEIVIACRNAFDLRVRSQ